MLIAVNLGHMDVNWTRTYMTKMARSRAQKFLSWSRTNDDQIAQSNLQSNTLSLKNRRRCREFMNSESNLDVFVITVLFFLTARIGFPTKKSNVVNAPRTCITKIKRCMGSNVLFMNNPLMIKTEKTAFPCCFNEKLNRKKLSENAFELTLRNNSAILSLAPCANINRSHTLPNSWIKKNTCKWSIYFPII